MKSVMRSTIVRAVCCAAVLTGGVALAPSAAARGCPTGFATNPYNGQCLAPAVSTPVINGIPCVASNIGICSSFLQNQQPPRRPQSSIG
jgi:hypothetical protein